MTGKTGSGRRWGGTSGALLALLLLFRLLVPAGYMIAPDETGRPVLALCGGAGAEPAVGPTQGHRHHGHPGAPVPSKPDGHSCPFAALAAPPLPPAPPVVPPPPAEAAAAQAGAPLHVLSRPALAAPPPPATGPPVPA